VRSVEEHQRVVAGLISPRPTAAVRLTEAHGLVLASDVTAPLPLPVFDNSAMDGYAVRSADVAGAGPGHPVTLPVAEDIPAGRTDALTLAPGTAHRIMTGAPLPAGADAVVPVELTDAGGQERSDPGNRAGGQERSDPGNRAGGQERSDPGNRAGAVGSTVAIRTAPEPGRHIRRAGEDVTAGDTVLRAGRVVTPAALGLLAALGCAELHAIPRQRVLVISTGSELVDPGTPLRPGQIYESNAVMLAAAVAEAGAEVAAVATSSDDVGEFRALLEAHAGKADLIVTSGGVSAGAYEVVKDTFSTGVDFVKVAMQPGMPQGAGTVHGIPIVTLPGNPVSVLVSFEVFVRPALRAAMGLPPHRPRRSAVLAEPLTSPRGKRQFRRGVFETDSCGAGTVTSYGPPASHHLRWLASANCLLDIGEDVTEVAAGEKVTVWDLSQ
jgi:molybdopterin molybdotransferase